MDDQTAARHLNQTDMANNPEVLSNVPAIDASQTRLKYAEFNKDKLYDECVDFSLLPKNNSRHYELLILLLAEVFHRHWNAQDTGALLIECRRRGYNGLLQPDRQQLLTILVRDDNMEALVSKFATKTREMLRSQLRREHDISFPESTRKWTLINTLIGIEKPEWRLSQPGYRPRRPSIVTPAPDDPPSLPPVQAVPQLQSRLDTVPGSQQMGPSRQILQTPLPAQNASHSRPPVRPQAETFPLVERSPSARDVARSAPAPPEYHPLEMTATVSPVRIPIEGSQRQPQSVREDLHQSSSGDPSTVDLSSVDEISSTNQADVETESDSSGGEPTEEVYHGGYLPYFNDNQPVASPIVNMAIITESNPYLEYEYRRAVDKYQAFDTLCLLFSLGYLDGHQTERPQRQFVNEERAAIRQILAQKYDITKINAKVYPVYAQGLACETNTTYTEGLIDIATRHDQKDDLRRYTRRTDSDTHCQKLNTHGDDQDGKGDKTKTRIDTEFAIETKTETESETKTERQSENEIEDETATETEVSFERVQDVD